MSGPKPPGIELSGAERRAVESLVRAGTSAQQLVQRARIILAAADGLNNTQVGARLGMAAKAARQWRERWRALTAVPLAELSVAERLEDAPRAGAPPRLTAEQVCAIVALACEQPAGCDRPISQWSARELADEIVQRGITASISPRHAGRLLKRGRCSHTAAATGSRPPAMRSSARCGLPTSVPPTGWRKAAWPRASGT
jgi:putative transposase